MHNYMLADIARVLKKRSVRVGIPGFELCLALLGFRKKELSF